MHQFDYLAHAQIERQQWETQVRLKRALLIREATAGRRAAFLQPMLVSVGKRLEKWGAGLQARYSVPLEIGHSGTLVSDAAC